MLLNATGVNMNATSVRRRLLAKKSRRAIVRFVPTVIGSGPVQFAGSFREACEYVWRQSEGDRRDLLVKSAERSYAPAEIEAMRSTVCSTPPARGMTGRTQRSGRVENGSDRHTPCPMLLKSSNDRMDDEIRMSRDDLARGLRVHLRVIRQK